MTPASPAEPTPRALGESLAALAAQIADLRGQIRTISGRLDQSGLSAGVNLAARFEELAQTVTGALEAAAPRGPAAPYWIGLDRDTYATRLADLRQWADTVLRQQYGGYELRDCWPKVILSTRFSYPRTSASGKARRISPMRWVTAFFSSPRTTRARSSSSRTSADHSGR